MKPRPILLARDGQAFENLENYPAYDFETVKVPLVINSSLNYDGNRTDGDAFLEELSVEAEKPVSEYLKWETWDCFSFYCKSEPWDGNKNTMPTGGNGLKESPFQNMNIAIETALCVLEKYCFKIPVIIHLSGTVNYSLYYSNTNFRGMLIIKCESAVFDFTHASLRYYGIKIPGVHIWDAVFEVSRKDDFTFNISSSLDDVFLYPSTAWNCTFNSEGVRLDLPNLYKTKVVSDNTVGTQGMVESDIECKEISMNGLTIASGFYGQDFDYGEMVFLKPVCVDSRIRSHNVRGGSIAFHKNSSVEITFGEMGYFGCLAFIDSSLLVENGVSAEIHFCQNSSFKCNAKGGDLDGTSCVLSFSSIENSDFVFTGGFAGMYGHRMRDITVSANVASFALEYLYDSINSLRYSDEGLFDSQFDISDGYIFVNEHESTGVLISHSRILNCSADIKTKYYNCDGFKIYNDAAVVPDDFDGNSCKITFVSQRSYFSASAQIAREVTGSAYSYNFSATVQNTITYDYVVMYRQFLAQVDFVGVDPLCSSGASFSYGFDKTPLQETGWKITREKALSYTNRPRTTYLAGTVGVINELDEHHVPGCNGGVVIAENYERSVYNGVSVTTTYHTEDIAMSPSGCALGKTVTRDYTSTAPLP